MLLQNNCHRLSDSEQHTLLSQYYGFLSSVLGYSRAHCAVKAVHELPSAGTTGLHHQGQQCSFFRSKVLGSGQPKHLLETSSPWGLGLGKSCFQTSSGGWQNSVPQGDFVGLRLRDAGHPWSLVELRLFTHNPWPCSCLLIQQKLQEEQERAFLCD